MIHATLRDPRCGQRPSRSQVAAKIAALMVKPDRPRTSFNVAGNPAGDQTWVLNARNIMEMKWRWTAQRTTDPTECDPGDPDRTVYQGHVEEAPPTPDRPHPPPK